MSKSLKDLKNDLVKHFGEGSVLLIGQEEKPVTDIIPTGIFSLDKALGVGGLPRGRIISISGPSGSGKTTTAIYPCIQAQKQGLNVAFIDMEHALDLAYCEELGLEPKNMLLSQPNDAETALAIIKQMVESGDVGVIVLDSIASLAPKAELEGEVGQSHMALQARLMSQFCRMVTPSLSKSNTMLIALNQTRKNIGVMYGPANTEPGGEAIKFYSSVRMEVAKADTLKEKDKVIGHNIKIKIVKNKLAAPYTTAMLPLIYGKGVDVVQDVFNLAVEAEIIQKAGAWFSMNGDKLGQGAINAINTIASKDGLLEDIIKKLNESVKPKQEFDE